MLFRSSLSLSSVLCLFLLPSTFSLVLAEPSFLFLVFVLSSPSTFSLVLCEPSFFLVLLSFLSSFDSLGLSSLLSSFSCSSFDSLFFFSSSLLSLSLSVSSSLCLFFSSFLSLSLFCVRLIVLLSLHHCWKALDLDGDLSLGYDFLSLSPLSSFSFVFFLLLSLFLCFPTGTFLFVSSALLLSCFLFRSALLLSFLSLILCQFERSVLSLRL